jgi:signal transduction histidine kinase
MSDAVHNLVSEPEGGGEARLLCHDLRQPLAAIMLIAGEATAQTSEELGERTRARLHQIENQATSLAEMIDATLSRGSNDPNPGPRERALVDPALEAVSALTRLTYEGDITLVRGAPGAAVPMSPVLLRRVVANLIDNAARAAGSDGGVLVSSRVVLGRAVIDVDDDGPGWARIAKGHGLGLAFVTEAVKAAGGTLTARRTRSGRTRVRVELPLAGSEG